MQSSFRFKSNRFHHLFLRHSYFFIAAIALLLSTSQTTHSQTLTQTIRGIVVDKSLQTPIAGASIVLVGSQPLRGTTTSTDGDFSLPNVPIGRQTLKVTYMGYKESIMSNIVVNAGKELVLTIGLEEDITQLAEITVKPTVEKDKPLNDMATVSARTFSVEETQRYAAAVNDPARMATAYAGVMSADDGGNNIVIRGNSPNGLLWRMEGIDIPNPNHFSSLGASGGGISILSAQVLTNSDFMTGAFSAEYGNALSGVFDLKLRKGNNQKREYTIQAGLLGLDVAAEGPFSTKYKGSYLINYRYSTLELLSKIGLPVGDFAQRFQDISYNISLPTQKWGKFTLFGFGGLSSSTGVAKADSTLWKTEGDKRFDEKFKSNTGAWGATHSLNFSPNALLKTVVLYSAYENGFRQKRYTDNYVFEPRYDEHYQLNKLSVSSTLNYKFNARLAIRTGAIWSHQTYDFFREAWDAEAKKWERYVSSKGQTATLQIFAQANYKLTERLTANLGVHTLRLFLNSRQSIEPRASVKWDLATGQSLALGYGLHSQTHPLALYFYSPTATGDIPNRYPNQSLNFTKAHHLVLSYDRLLSEHTRLKTEAYYQALYGVPVSANQRDAISILNVADGFISKQLANNGRGENYGFELTLERFLHNNFYYLVSGSVFKSRYQGSDEVWRSTRFDAGSAVNVLVGKEWQLGQGRNNVLGINLKTTYMGGYRTTPIDLAASRRQGQTVWIDAQTNQDKLDSYFRSDVRVSWKRNKNGFTSTLSLDLQNATNRQNVYNHFFDSNLNEVRTVYQLPLIPILNYRVEF
ncbi:MAG: TonB-dependent receptor [Bacteroidetes bacterium]|nr:TonB-dependent receptor [Bacteroidota bacterium]